MRSPKSLVFFFLLTICGNSLSQTSVPSYPQVANYLGKWKFVSEESFNGESDRKLYSSYMISIDRIDDKLRITREFVYNSIAYSREALINLDGSGEINPAADSYGKISMVSSRSKLRKGAIVREFARELAAGLGDTETFRISGDGTRLVVEGRYTPRVQVMYPNILKPELSRIDSYWSVSSKSRKERVRRELAICENQTSGYFVDRQFQPASCGQNG